jgi:hypothetical protein
MRAADAVKFSGAILGNVVVLMLIPLFLVNAWSDLSFWQQIALATIGVGV